jgi:hypothetical protein
MGCKDPRRTFCALLFGVMVFSACSSEEKPAPKPAPSASPAVRYEELKFVADPTFLGFVCSEPSLGISIAPPRDWPSMDPDSLAKLQSQYDKLAAGNNNFVARPVRIFYEKNRRLFMSISRFPSWPVVMSPQTAIGQYRQLVMQAMPDAQMMDGFFRNGDVTGYRLLLVNNMMANFRIVVLREGQAPVQVNYLVPRGLFPELQKAIEASVGSIRYI